MSYQNGTTHYNLPQTVGTDKRDWFDTNEAFADLDSAVYGAVQTGTVNTQKIEQAEETVGQLNTRVEGVEGDVADIKVDVATAKEDIATQGVALSGLTNQVRDNKSDLEDMITAYEEETATASASHNVGDYFRYNNVLYITTITIRVGDTIVPDVNCRSTNVMTRVRALENQGGGQTPLASSVMYDNTTSGLTADNVQGAIDEIDGTLDIVSQGVQTNGTHIGDLTALLTTAKGNLVGAINELVGMIGGGGMPLLDFANPLHTFDNPTPAQSGHGLTFTASKECYLCGAVNPQPNGESIVSIDGTPIAKGIGSSGSYECPAYVSPIKIKSGTVVTATHASNGLHVFDVLTV